MEAAGSYLQEEIEWVRASITTPRPEAIILLPKERTDKLKREWKDDDPTVPPGWKVAWTTTSDNRSKIAFMSPDKKIFHSRKAALQHMMAAGTYDPEDIVKMTKGLNVLLNVGDEWKEGDKSLPDGWKIRSHQWWCQKRNSHRIHYEFLSPHNEFFKSRKAVVEHMMQNGVYTEEQIETVRQQTTIITDRSGKQKKGVTAGVGGVAKEVSSPCNPLIGWKAGNSSLPPGWKIKRHEYANQTVYFYMSPKGDIIKSRRAVIDYMFKDESYTEIKMGGLEPPLHNSIKDEFMISSDEGPNDSIQVDPKEENDSQFYVKDGKVDLAKVSPVANNSETSAEAAYAVVVNVLRKLSPR